MSRRIGPRIGRRTSRRTSRRLGRSTSQRPGPKPDRGTIQRPGPGTSQRTSQRPGRRTGRRPIGTSVNPSRATPTRCEDPVAVEGEAKHGAEHEAYDVARDVVRENARVAQHVVAKPQAANSDAHAHQAHCQKLDALTQSLALPVLAEGPVAVADPVHRNGQDRGNDLGVEGAGVHIGGIQHGGAQQVEDGEVHHEAECPHGTKLEALTQKTEQALLQCYRHASARRSVK